MTTSSDMQGRELLAQGAEGRVFKMSYMGLPCVLKERFTKKYRHPELDSKLTKKRLLQETRALLKSYGKGVVCPVVYHVDRENYRIYMEYIDAPAVRVHLNCFSSAASDHCDNNTIATNNDDPRNDVAEKIGVAIGRLHAADIIHGDLTTSNMLWREGHVVLIDFGLSYTSKLPEDKGVDLYVLERAFLSTHPNSDALFLRVLEAYTNSYEQSGPTINRLSEVRRRGRKRDMSG
eukprot:CFRG0579T1